MAGGGAVRGSADTNLTAFSPHRDLERDTNPEFWESEYAEPEAGGSLNRRPPTAWQHRGAS